MLYEVITWTQKVGVTLEYRFDSDGPDAWNANEHPLVFMTTEGPGYGGLLSGVTLPGLAIIDARITSYNVCYTKLLRVLPGLNWLFIRHSCRGPIEIPKHDRH